MDTKEIFWPHELPGHTKVLLQHLATTRSFEPGEFFLMGRGIDNGYCYLRQGLMVLGIDGVATSSPFAIFKAGDWFGGTTLNGDPDFIYRIGAIEPSSLLFIPDQSLRDAAIADSDIYKLLYLTSATHANNAIDLLFAATSLSLPQKIAYFLYKISKRFPQVEGAKPAISMSQATLAQLLGLSRLTLNQQLQILEQNGVISVARKKVYILNLAALENLAGIGKPTA